MKRISLVLSVALVAGIVAFSACKKNKDDDGAAAEGKKAAKEFCDCFKTHSEYFEQIECTVGVNTKYAKYDDNNAFWNAYDKEIVNCKDIPEDW
jgi:hypothetical protein